jgi:aspartate/glutamate racemase
MMGMEAIVPGEDEMKALGGLIYQILSGRRGNGQRAEMAGLARPLAVRGAEAIILGCTDLQHLVRPVEGSEEGTRAGAGESDDMASAPAPAVAVDPGLSPLPLVDSLETLAEAAVKEMAE